MPFWRIDAGGEESGARSGLARHLFHLFGTGPRAKGIVRWKRDVALASAAVLFSAAAVLAAVPDPIQIIKRGAQVFVSMVGHNAALRAELWFFGNTPVGPGMPFIGNGRFLFSTFGGNSILNGATPVGPDFDLSGILGSPLADGTQLYFALFVQDEFPTALGDARNAWFFIGGPEQNPDSTVHARVVIDSAGNYVIGFEDLCTQDVRWCDRPAFTEDFDYNDLVFKVSMTPEPGSLALMGTGLLGMTGLIWRRRSKARARQGPLGQGLS